MAFERPHMPTVEEIRARAIELYMMDQPPELRITPEDHELKEENYWRRAQLDIMSGGWADVRSEQEEMVRFHEEEAKRLREELGEKIEVTPEEVRDLKETITDLRSKYRQARKNLKEAEEQIETLEEEKKRIPPPPPPKPPVVAPPPLPPPPPPPPPVERGLSRADEDALKDLFYTRLMEAGYSPSRARGHLPEFRLELTTLREEFKDVPRDEAVSKARAFIEGLVDRILARAPPVAVVPVKVPEVVPEVVRPVVPPIVIAPPVEPPVGVLREWGMPWSWHLCPACVGEGKPEEACKILRSPYLENRLRRIALPTGDPLFYKLCPDHKRKYGGSFEYFPRDTVEFWVGEAIMKAEINISVLVGLGIGEEYLHHCTRVYEANKHLAVQ